MHKKLRPFTLKWHSMARTDRTAPPNGQPQAGGSLPVVYLTDPMAGCSEAEAEDPT